MELQRYINSASDVDATTYSQLLQRLHIKTIKDLGEEGCTIVNNRYVAIFDDGCCVGFTCESTNISQALECLDKSMLLNMRRNVKMPISQKRIDCLSKKIREGHCLYHYTKFDTAVKILSSKLLRFGRLENLNDINESYRMVVFDRLDCKVQPDKILSKYRQLSLTQDMSYEDGTVVKGFDIPAMWAHYAEKGKGVCLVLNRKQIVKKLGETACMHQAVEYDRGYDETIHLTGDDPSTELAENIEDIFFKKTLDWRYEQEYRAVKKEPDESVCYLDLAENTILAVILYSGGNLGANIKSVYASSEYLALGKLGGRQIPILTYGRFMGEPCLSCSERTHYVWTRSGEAYEFTEMLVGRD